MFSFCGANPPALRATPLIRGAKDVSEFFAMGGYGFYVWGSYGVTFALLAIEVVVLMKRKRETKT